MAQVIQIEQLVDEQKIGWFNINLFIWSFLAMFADGYDITAMAFAAPDMGRQWGINSASFGPAFSASLFGILFGAPLLGFIGDRYGRKVAILTGCLIYGFCTLVIIWTTNLDQVIVLRFIAGIGIGGLLPNTISLNTELSPKRLRATLTVLMFTGITLGGGTPSIVSAWLVPHFSWKILFMIGGLVPLIIAGCLLFTLPESVKFLVQYPHKYNNLLAIARQLRRDLIIKDDAEFVLSQPHVQSSSVGMKEIFSNGLVFITPLLWLCFSTALMANYFLNSWMPLLFESNGMPPDQAALASGGYQIGGTIGGILISILMDRFGFAVIAALFILAIPCIAAIGFDGISFGELTLISTLAGVTVLGAQFGNNAAAGQLYPTAFRSKGVGWALAIGRFGSILGPLLGGILIGMKIPMSLMFQIVTIPMLIGAIAALFLTRICFVHFQGFQLDDTPA